MTELTALQQLAYDAVAEIQDMKQLSHKSPDFATIDEVINYTKEELLEALRQLYRQGKIEFHKTVNGVPMFGIRPQENE